MSILKKIHEVDDVSNKSSHHLSNNICDIDSDTTNNSSAITNVDTNTNADVAGEYQHELGAYSPLTHMYPSSPVVLEINGMTITSNI